MSSSRNAKKNDDIITDEVQEDDQTFEFANDDQDEVAV